MTPETKAAIRECAQIADVFSVAEWKRFKDDRSDHYIEGKSDGADDVRRLIIVRFPEAFEETE